MLLDAAEALMLEEGYAAVTARRVASRAGLKWQLVHYYFRTMDDLFLAMFRRRAEEGLQRHARALSAPRPLRALWGFSVEPDAVAFTMEFAALANHRKAIRAEIARYAELFRAADIEAMSRLVERYHIPAQGWPASVLAVMMSSLSRMVVMEQALGMSGGHQETLAMVEGFLDEFEPDDAPPAG
ncbi:MAG TPA: helix-turn-helix domain-containing protein [Rugosimonospora sp.]|nr:helix-turn-helix domain-containing protein [Rugosimonospora sp.]